MMLLVYIPLTECAFRSGEGEAPAEPRRAGRLALPQAAQLASEIRIGGGPQELSMAQRTYAAQTGKALTTAIALIAVAIGLHPRLIAQAAEKDKKHAPMTFAQAMQVLQQWLGGWTAVERHFDSAGHLAGETKGTEETRLILDDRAIERVYRSAGTAEVYEAQGTFTYDESDGSFIGVWFDNRSTFGPTQSKATWDPETRTMVYENMRSGPGGAVETYRTVERLLDAERRQATTYRVRGQEVIKLLEVSYTRAQPCPESKAIMRILDEDDE